MTSPVDSARRAAPLTAPLTALCAVLSLAILSGCATGGDDFPSAVGDAGARTLSDAQSGPARQRIVLGVAAGGAEDGAAQAGDAPTQVVAAAPSLPAAPAGAPDARDRAVWAACRPQVVAERCMAYDPTSGAMESAFRRWRRANDKRLTRLYRYIASRGGLFNGDIDRTPLFSQRGDAVGQVATANHNVLIRYCEHAAQFFRDDPRSPITFPTPRDVVRELRSAPEGDDPDAAAVKAVRRACETPLP